MDDARVAEVVARVAVSRRYRWVAEPLVARLAAEELPKARNLDDAEKRVKRRLHQIFGAYTGQPDYARLLLDLQRARDAGDAALRDACRAALAAHASTRERLPLLDAFYARIFALTGPPRTLLDLACGLNPLAAPWMALPEDACYHACDIDRALLDCVAGALDLLGISHDVELRDVVSDPPDDRCDVALLLKTVPPLDQQDPRAAERLLRAVRARWLVVSFPTRSLSGHGKGMERSYRARFATLRAECGWQGEVEELVFANELVYVVRGERE